MVQQPPNLCSLSLFWLWPLTQTAKALEFPQGEGLIDIQSLPLSGFYLVSNHFSQEPSTPVKLFNQQLLRHTLLNRASTPLWWFCQFVYFPAACPPIQILPVIFFFFWPCHTARRILVPQPEIKYVALCPLQWKHIVLTIGSPGKSCHYFESVSHLHHWSLIDSFANTVAASFKLTNFNNYATCFTSGLEVLDIRLHMILWLSICCSQVRTQNPNDQVSFVSL